MKYIFLALALTSCAHAQNFNPNYDPTDDIANALRNQATMGQSPKPQPVKVQLVDQYGRPIEFER